MHNFLLRRFLEVKDFLDQEEGQDMIEYALVSALVALGATASLGNFASGVSLAFSKLNIKLGTWIT